MDITGEKLKRDINAPRRLTRSMAAKTAMASANISVDGNRRVTRSATKHLRERNPGGTELDADIESTDAPKYINIKKCDASKKWTNSRSVIKDSKIG